MIDSPKSKNKIALTADLPIEEGIYLDLSSDDYHNDKESISRSSLMDFKKSERNYWAMHLNPDRPERQSKPSWEFGTAFHTLILEPHLFDEQYFVMPEKVFKKDNPELYEENKKLEEEAGKTSKQVLSRTDYERLCAMQLSLLSNGRAKELIEGAIYECSYFWKDEESGLMVKSRPDILHSNLYVDLKTIDDASPHNFQRSMAQHGYHIQAAMVKDGVKNLTGKDLLACINVCVEKTYPFSVGIYIIDELAIETGQAEYKSLLQRLKSCIVSDSWSDYQPETIGLPRWYL